MVHLRQEKIDRIAQDIPDLEVMGDDSGGLLVLGWGSTYGVITTAVQRARSRGQRVSAASLRHLNPFPKNLGDVLRRYDQVLIPEINLGQLRLLIRGKFLVDAIGLNKVSGRPFTIAEVEHKIEEVLG
jgi:2-oxoglutarate ferredoxin oxidoreductase subunit alpha